MEDELLEGRLHLRHDDGGWRHYIRDGDQDRNIYCGSYMEVQLGFVVDDGQGAQILHKEWLRGRYEAYLTAEPVKAYLAIGDFFPAGRP